MTTARDLTAQLASLLRREHAAMAEFIVALADFDRKRIWVELGHNGLFTFLHRELGLSKSAAFYRKTAAELAQRFPEVVEPLREGKLCLSSVAELAKVLTPENRHEVLPRFFHASRQEAKEILAELVPDPAPARRDVVTAVAAAPAAPARVESGSPAVLSTDLPLSSGSPANLVRANSDGEHRGLSSQRQEERDDVEPLTTELRRLHLTVDREFLELLEATRDTLSHSHPGATTSEILKTCMKRMLAEKGEAEGDRRETAEGAVRVRLRGSNPCAREEGGVETRRREVPVEDGLRRDLRIHEMPRVRAPEGEGARGEGDGREHSIALPVSQSVRGPHPARGRGDGPVLGDAGARRERAAPGVQAFERR
jgi:hypothetical protein